MKKQVPNIEKKIDVSFVIPVYNTRDYLEECINSVLEDEALSVEIICIDDGSTDGSFEFLNDLSCKIGNVTIVSQKHQGQSTARNKGIEMASGEYIAFLDSDDYYRSNTIAKLYSIATTNQLDLLLFDTTLVYEDETLRDKQDDYYRTRFGYENVTTGAALLSHLVEKDEYIDSAGLMLIKRKWLLENEISFYEGIFYEDSLFCLKCMLTAKRVMHAPISAYVYRIRKNSTMTTEPTIFNVKSKLTVFGEALRLYYMLEESQCLVRKTLLKVLSRMVDGVRYYDKNRKDLAQTYSNLTEYEELLFKVFKIGDVYISDRRVLITGLLTEVTRSKGVIIFGAGDFGKALYTFLDKEGLSGKVEGFAVTKLVENEKELFGKIIYCINDITCDDKLVIIAAGKKNRTQMEQTLKENRLENYIHADNEMITAINLCMRRRPWLK